MILFSQSTRTLRKHVYATLRVMILVVGLVAPPGQHVAAQTPSTNASPHPPRTTQTQEGANETNRIIIKFRDTEIRPSSLNEQAMKRLRDRSGVDLQYFRSMSGEAHVFQLPERLPLEQVRTISETLMTLPEVEYAEPDQIILPFRTPNDPEYGNQWHYYDTWGINAPAAWDLTTGSSKITIAVIDTGITDHPDLNGRAVAGYDFISDAWKANDGDGRDHNPSDPGDWAGPGECSPGSLPQDSSWHGTHVAGTIGAISNNWLGVAGINWNSKILPVRVLGRCGGSLSDLVDAMRWAAGLSVPGVPANPNPAKVLNLSLGGDGTCGASLQGAVNSIRRAGAVIVVAAGNSLSDANDFTPANCNGVITVAATDESGDLALYSNYGSTVEISAPGGGFFSGVLSTSNSGTTVPASSSYTYSAGTSMAAPHVSGVVSLMLSRNPSLTPDQVLQILQTTAKNFPAGGFCDSWIPCGSGIVNAGAAVAAVPRSTFTDVPMSYWAWDFIERLYAAGITQGCTLNPHRYCPESTITRAEIAVLLERSIHGASYVPPAVGSSTGFGDVTPTYWAAPWIKQLVADGITAGCGRGNYCPEALVTRAQVAVFLLRSKHGTSYTPPNVGGNTGFGDVPPTHWAAAWIRQLVKEGITSGCGNGNYCPDASITRAEMAVFLVKTFDLP